VDGRFAGVAYIFDLGSGRAAQTLHSPHPQPGGRFGQSVAINRQFAAVGFAAFPLVGRK
jgi:hypothetical protein